MLPGDPPDAAGPPPGCGFHPRCPLAVDRCRTEVPALRAAGPGRLAACHRAAEVLAGLPLRLTRPAGLTLPCLTLSSAGRVHHRAGDVQTEREVHAVLTLTNRAAETIRTLISQPGVPSETGLRMSLPDGDAGALTLSLEGPQPGDEVIEDSGARVFVRE